MPFRLAADMIEDSDLQITADGWPVTRSVALQTGEPRGVFTSGSAPAAPAACGSQGTASRSTPASASPWLSAAGCSPSSPPSSPRPPSADRSAGRCSAPVVVTHKKGATLDRGVLDQRSDNAQLGLDCVVFRRAPGGGSVVARVFEPRFMTGGRRQ